MYRIDDATAATSLPAPEAALAEGFFTEGNAAAGTPATNVRGSWLNMIQEEMRAIVVAAGLTPSKTAYNQVLQAIRTMTADGARVQGLLGQNNATTPSTQFDFSALSVTLRNSTTGATTVVSNTGSLTNNILLAGPAANGRDQSGSFSASQWLRFYFIWNPATSTIATISSVNNPALGPALPSGYTHWAYIGSVYLSSSSILAGGNFRGSRFNYNSLVTALSGGTSTGLVAVSVANLVPPEAGWFELFFQSLAITTSASGAYNINCQIVTQATQIFNIGLTGGGTASVIASVSGPSKQITNFGQSFAYQLTVGAGAGPAVTIDVPGYSVPNGGE